LILLDTSGLLSALVADEVAHAESRRVLETHDQPFVLSPFVLAELDNLIAARAGSQAELAILAEVGSGTYELATFDADDVVRAADVIARYGDLGVGLTDASIVVLAERYGTTRVLTLDERHFRALRTHEGRAFTVLPADT
jgi:uncharacterized protein